MANVFGKIQLADFEALTEMPQRAASAWAVMDDAAKVGAEFKPVLYCGKQVVHGTNHYFIAERVIQYATPIRNLVRLTIYEHDGEYEFLDDSVMEIL